MDSSTDKITDTRNGTRPIVTTVDAPRAAGATSLECIALTGWPTASKVHFITYKPDTAGKPLAGTQLDCEGIVSGSTIVNITVRDGNDTGNTINDVVQIHPTASWGQDLAEGITKEHNRDGSHNSAAIATIKAAIFPLIFPVGSIYTNADNQTNPSSLLGFGTWAPFGEGRVLVSKSSSGTFQTAGDTGGAETHTLTVDQMPAHNHTDAGHAHGTSVYDTPAGGSYGLQAGGGAQRAVTSGTGVASANIQNRGGGQAHNNLQPYVVVYMWRRTA